MLPEQWPGGLRSGRGQGLKKHCSAQKQCGVTGVLLESGDSDADMPLAAWIEPETAGAGTSVDAGRRVPGWAAWGDDAAAFGAVILARRWRNHGLTPAQVFLVLDGVLPPHWDDQERLLLMDDEEAW